MLFKLLKIHNFKEIAGIMVGFYFYCHSTHPPCVFRKIGLRPAWRGSKQVTKSTASLLGQAVIAAGWHTAMLRPAGGPRPLYWAVSVRT